MDIPEKLATQGTQDEEKQNTTQCVIRKQIQITRHEPSYKQLEVKTNLEQFLYGTQNIKTHNKQVIQLLESHNENVIEISYGMEQGRS